MSRSFFQPPSLFTELVTSQKLMNYSEYPWALWEAEASHPLTGCRAVTCISSGAQEVEDVSWGSALTHLQLDPDIWSGRSSHPGGDKSPTTSCIHEVEDKQLCNPLGKQRTRSSASPPVQDAGIRRRSLSLTDTVADVQLQLCLWYGWWESYSA